MNIFPLQVSSSPVPAKGHTLDLFRNKPVDQKVVRAGDLWLNSFEKFNQALDNRENLTGTVWVATPDKEGKYPKYWHRAFHGTINSDSGEVNLEAVQHPETPPETWLYGFPVGFNGLERDVIKVSPDSLLIFDLKAEEPYETLARKLCAKVPTDPEFKPVESIITIDDQGTHLDSLNSICEQAYDKFKEICKVRQFYDEAIRRSDDIRMIRRDSSSVNVYSPNIRIMHLSKGKEQEIFNLFRKNKQIEDLIMFSNATKSSELKAWFYASNEEEIYSGFQVGDQLKVIVEYPNAN